MCICIDLSMLDIMLFSFSVLTVGWMTEHQVCKKFVSHPHVFSSDRGGTD